MLALLPLCGIVLGVVFIGGMVRMAGKRQPPIPTEEEVNEELNHLNRLSLKRANKENR